jgi:flagellar biosynthesis protein FlhA
MAEGELTSMLTLKLKGITAEKLARYKDFVFALSIVGILLVLLFPVPTFLLDFLLAISITTSVIILMTALLINRPLDLSIFPTLLLITAILRLSLNVASTRLILSRGHLGPDAAGQIIEAFGNFVMSGHLVIGIIVYIILTIINFIVITKGSGRIAEVAARFSLDSMPGKQMAIDADLSAGLIDEATAKHRRKELEDESTFFGSMDGANKFVRGDAVAGLLITIVNLIAGIVMGVVEKDLPFMKALHTYSVLTVGDGLVAQIPALVISLAAGLMVTKSGAIGSTDKILFAQLSKYPNALALSSSLMICMAFIPGMPFIPFILIGGLIGSCSYFISRDYSGRKKDSNTLEVYNSKKEVSKDLHAGENVNEIGVNENEEQAISAALQIDILKLELSYNLLPIINNNLQGYKLTEQIKALRKQLAKDMGFVIPSVRIQDNLQLSNNFYSIKVKDLECAKGEVRANMYMVMHPQGSKIELKGEETKEPTFGLPAMWVDESQKEEALDKDYTIVDVATVITTHLTEVIKENIIDLLSYSETQKLLDELGQKHSKLIADTIPDLVSISSVQRILQNLLAEGVSIRDLSTIMEAINECTRTTKSVRLITEFVRARLARQISYAHVNESGYLPIIKLSQEWEQAFSESLVAIGEDKQLSLAPSKLQEFIEKFKAVYDQLIGQGEIAIILVPANIRPYLREIIARFYPAVSVVSPNEIHPKIQIKTLNQI